MPTEPLIQLKQLNSRKKKYRFQAPLVTRKTAFAKSYRKKGIKIFYYNTF